LKTIALSAREPEYSDCMRVYEVVMKSGAKAEITAEILHDDPAQDNKIYFYRDKGLKQLVAFFLRDEVAGIVLGADTAGSQVRYK
jgi:hypothetical protein